MTDQLRIRGLDPRMLSPNRDLAHCMPGLLQATSLRFHQGTWPAVEDYLISSGVRKDELQATAQVLISLAIRMREDPSTSLEKCLQTSGWFDLPEAAKIGYLAMLGSVVLCVHAAGVRQAAVLGDGPKLDEQDVGRQIGEMHRRLSPGVGHRLYRRCRAWLSRRFTRPPIPQEEIDAADGSVDESAQPTVFGRSIDL